MTTLATPQRKFEETVIDGIKYRMTQVGGETGDEIVLRLARPLAALFARVAQAAKKKGLDPETSMVSIEELLITGAAPALAALSSKDLRFIRRKLAAECTVFLPDGRHEPKPWPLSEHYDDHFRGRYVQSAQWLFWGLRMNRFFGSALDHIAALIEARKVATAAAQKAAAEKAAASRSSSPRDADGGPGASSSPSTAGQA